MNKKIIFLFSKLTIFIRSLFSKIKSIFNIFSFEKIKQILESFFYITTGSFSLLVIFLFIFANIKGCNNNGIEYEYTIYRSMSELHYSQSKAMIVEEIDNYIDSVAPSSCLNGISLFEACDKYDIDICFVMAQAQLESRFGTTGVASKTNSVWNVMAYDGRTAKDINKKGHGFDHPDKSIKPYMELLKNKYLSDKKTEYDLLKKYTDINGRRYASDNKYESKLSNIYSRIINSTNISKYYKEYKKYKMILQVEQ